MSYRFDISGAFDRVPHSKKEEAFKEIFETDNRQCAFNHAYLWRKNQNLKLSAKQIETICRVCGISLNEFFIND